MSQSVHLVRCIVVLTGVLALASGCAHPLVVKNLDTYQVSGSMAQATKKSIGVTATCATYNDQLILNGVADNLRRYAGSVVTPYTKGDDQKVDVVANIDLRSQYDGSGVNFLITWPGFLIWTPAWNGYVYHIRHDFDITLRDGESDDTIETFSIPVALSVRHADMNRTALAEVGGWFFWSVPAFIGGFIHIGYDRNVSQLEAKEVAPVLGDFVAQEIVRRIPSDKAKASAEKETPTDEPQTTLDASLRALHKLKEDGLITQDEFDVQKKSLLEKY